MTTKQAYVTKNNCYTSSRKRTSTAGVILHATATPGATASAFAKAWNTPTPSGREVCVHYFLDDNEAVQILPLDIRCWGCGSGVRGSGNDSYVQIEMCELKTNTKEYVEKVAENACQLIASILKQYGIGNATLRSCIGHAEAHSMGIASNHSDPAGFLAVAGLDMEYIRKRVNEILSGNVSPAIPDESTDTSEPSDEIIESNTSELVKVTASALNIRSGPGTGYGLTGQITDKGIYTIVDTSGNWGKLKSGAGWICLDYTSKVEEVINNEAYPKLVRITASALNVRSEPSLDAPVVTVIRDKGVYTVTSESGDWYKLKSGAGFISKSYAKVID